MEGAEPRPTAAQIRTLSPGNGYVAYHAPRYAVVLRMLVEHVTAPDARVLDVGPSPLTDLIETTLGVKAETLGFAAEATGAARDHHVLDLNDTRHPERCPSIGPYDAIVMGEVIEHLYTSPAFVLRYLHSILRPGGILILQTPNAARLTNRLKVLAGRNALELIREDETNPGHFREYTEKELKAYADATGFAVVDAEILQYFDYRYRSHAGFERQPLVERTANKVLAWMPRRLRPGLTMVLRRT
jgi:SAM-dependent methyltransferase